MMDKVIRVGALAAVLVGMGWTGWAQDVGGGGAEVGAGVGSGAGAGKRPMTFADLQRMKRVGDPQISPSGKWVMFSVVDVDLAKNSKVSHLWVVPLGALGGGEPTSQSRDVGHPDLNGAERQVTFWKEGESGGRFSPDGKQVLFLATDSTTGLSQIFLAPWDEANGTVGTPVRLTNVSTEADGAVWSPNAKRILFTSRVYPECSDEESWLEEDACDKRKDDAAAANPVKAQVWTHLLYRHWDHYVGPKRSHVLVVSATDGNAVRDLTPRRNIGDAEAPVFSLGGPMGYAWSPGSEEIAYVTNLDLVPAASTNNDVFTLLLDDAGARPRKISTSLGSDDGPAYSPDGKYIAFRSQARAGYESDRFRLMLFDRFAGTTKELMPSFGGWVDEFVWNWTGAYLYFTSSYQGEERIYGVGPESAPTLVRKGAEFGSLVSVPMPGARRYLPTLLATKMKVDMPAEIVRIIVSDGVGRDEHVAVTYDQFGIADVNSSQESAVSHVNDGLIAQLDLPKMEPFWFTGAVNAKVQGFVIRPPGFDPSRRYPLKFLIHGGPQGAWGDAWSYRWNPELMAASGYVVVMVNPRGSTGYGQAFIDGVNGDWGGKAYVDLMKGLDYAEVKYPFIDKARECALGASYGGFMADWILTHTDRFACIVTHDGMFNPQSAYGDTEELWFNEWEFRRPAVAATKGHAAVVADGPGQPWRYAAGPIADDPFRRWSPMLSIQSAKTPTLVIHSQRDYRLDVSEGMQLFTALQRLNVPSRMLYFPDEGHWILKPQNSQLWYEEVGAWCDRWTKTGAYVPSTASAFAPAAAAPVTARPLEPAPRAAAPRRVPEAVVTAPVRPVAPAPAAVAAPLALAVPQSEGPVVPGAAFSIAIGAPQGAVRAGADVPVSIVLKNVSDHQVLFGHKPGRESAEFSYAIEVKDETGRVVPETEYGRAAKEVARQREEARTVDYLQPGGTTVQTAHLQKLVSLSRPGTYTVQVSRKDSLIDVVVRSNVATFTVGR